MNFVWPAGFPRIPSDDWTRQPLETLALKYDTVENHGWYKNLDRTVAQLEAYLAGGHLLVDYSGGTGILADRLLRQLGDRPVGIVIVDASPKFLRLSLEKFRGEERVAFRHIRYLKAEKRLEFVDDVLGVPADAVVSTNAIHLYYDLLDTLKSWTRVLKPGARAFVQSGNIRNPAAPASEWIIDETVGAIHLEAMEIVRKNAGFARYREVLEDAKRMKEYDAFRNKYFIPVRPLDHYLGALSDAGFTILDTIRETIEARVDEWYKFLSVYHEGVLGWIGGVEKIEGAPASEAAVSDRFGIMRLAMDRIFRGKPAFDCCWTYITARV